MNEWYTLTNNLETNVPALDEVSQARIEKRVRFSLPRRRKHRALAAIIAAVLVLSACGYAVATGQFSHWFWNMADPQAPESSEELLASMGTVIGQSQTVDGVTVTLNGALWDGETLMLSLTLEGDGLPQNYWTQPDTKDSWLVPSRKQVKKSLQAAYPEKTEVELESMIEQYQKARTLFGGTGFTYLYDWQSEFFALQIEQSFTSSSTPAELTLHLENLHIGGSTIQGPFEFTFTVEPRDVELVYHGTVDIEPVNGYPVRGTEVTLSPFRVEVSFMGLKRLELNDDGGPVQEVFPLSIDAIRVSGEVVVGFSRRSGSSQAWETDGSWNGCIRRGPFQQVVDPADIEAICINGTWLELSQMECNH